MELSLYLLFVLINTILSYRESELIKDDQKIYHGMNAAVYGILASLVALSADSWLVLTSLLIQRIPVYNTALNYFRGLPLTYTSDSTTSIIDRATNWISKKVGYWQYHITLIVISIILICL